MNINAGGLRPNFQQTRWTLIQASLISGCTDLLPYFKHFKTKILDFNVSNWTEHGFNGSNFHKSWLSKKQLYTIIS